MNKRVFSFGAGMAVFAVCLTLVFGAAVYSVLPFVSGAAAVVLCLGAAALDVLVCILVARLVAAGICSEIAGAVNSIDPECPDPSGLCPEFSPLVAGMRRHNARTAEETAQLKAAHRTQDDMRRDFTANVSHELKTPLTSISGYAEIIRDGIAKEDDVRRFAGKICDESRRLITLVGDIIKLSQLDGGDVQAKFEDLDLFEMCQGVISHLELEAGKRGVTFSLSGEHVHINGAEQVVDDIIFNICDNAVKYNKPGGKVDISLRQCVDGVELTVADTGIGMSAEETEHIFERFYRADKSHSKEIGGTGLGLSIVKHGVRFMGASVTVESSPGAGTVMRVLF